MACPSSVSAKLAVATSLLVLGHLLVGASASDEECQLYLAKSTIPGAGLGLFTATDIPEGSDVGAAFADVYIPIQDQFKTLPYRGQQHFLSWLGYVWPERIDAFYHTKNDEVFPYIPPARYGVDEGLNAADSMRFKAGNDQVSAFGPGIASLVNSEPFFVNIQKKLKSDRVDIIGISSGSNSFSPYHGVTFRSLSNIEAGSELFLDYGPTWHQRYHEKLELGDEYLPGKKGESDFGTFMSEEQKRLSNLDHRRDSEEILKQLERPSECKEGKTGRNKGGVKGSVQRVAFQAKDRQDETIREEEYFEEEAYDVEDEYFIRDVGWLKENGVCVDSLYAKPSTISNAGRGAFARRPIRTGEVIAPAPLLVAKRSDFDILYSARNEGQYRTDVHPDKIVGQELLLNYAYGHKDSEVLLVPNSPVVNFINHNGKEPNAFIRWPDSSILGKSKEWLEKHPLDVLNESGQIMMEFVALRDISSDEEIFIDYGRDWEEEHARPSQGEFRHEISVPSGFFPDAWLETSTVYEIEPIDNIKPGEVIQLKFKHNGQPVSESAHAVGLPSNFTASIRGYAHRTGMISMYNKLLLRDEPVLGDNQWFTFNDTEHHEWFAYSYKQQEWAFDMHYIEAWADEARQSLLAAMGNAGFDTALDAVGNYLGLDYITCYQSAYMGASKCENSVVHSDVFNTDGKSFNIIFPIVLVEGSKPELDIVADDTNVVLSVNYKENVAYFLTDEGGYHKTSAHNYDEISGIRIMVGSYCGQIDETVVNRTKNLYDLEVVPPFMDQFDLPLKEIHWSKEGGHSLADLGQSRSAQ